MYLADRRWQGAWSGDPALQWKLNLSALSQKEDLYFLALNDSIYADRPNLAADPFCDAMVCEFRWKLPITKEASDATDHHHARYPHGINHLVIGELGDEEVLACACDDGDIVSRFELYSHLFRARCTWLQCKLCGVSGTLHVSCKLSNRD